MRIQVNRELLEKKLMVVTSAMATKPLIPILDEALITMTSDSMSITASDNEVTITTNVAANVEGEPFNFVCDIRTILKVISNLKSEEVFFDISTDTAMFSTPRTKKKYEIPLTYKPDTFPTGMETEWEDVTVISGSILATMIKRASLFVNPMDLRKGMSGINFSVAGKELAIQATKNGHVLFKGSFINDFDVEGMYDIVVPKTIAKIISGYESSPEIKIRIDKLQKNIMISDGSYTTKCVLIADKFPNTNPFFKSYPKESNIVMNRESIMMSIKRLSAFKDYNSKSIIFDMKEDGLILRAEEKDFRRKAEENIDVSEKSSHIAFKSGFSYDFINAIINNLSGENITLCQTASHQSAYISDDSAEGFESVFVVAPIMIAEEKEEK